ncbi:hypothetical protein EV201_0636 [Ancylomarina subtilis]|uniref:YD repeat-containing protein n=1 Tax=Ancylomarina subtilis TaxID=1639035 RepID=A0A4Q7VIX3_9BACT|nr:hypothetical protein [Ancylomarina subtilis]RZT96007.1 hypothetical protein EV201_0636 [Ancylomarina subtilis]
MKKSNKIVIALFSIVIMYGCTHQSTNSDISKLNLKGKVKSIKEFSYTCKSKLIGDSVTYLKAERKREEIEEYYPEETSLNNDNILFFNEQGCIEKINLFTDGDIIFYNNRYEYDKDNKRITEYEYKYNSSKLAKISNYIYNDENLLKKKVIDNANGSPYGYIEYVYDDNDRKILTVGYRAGKGIIYKKNYKYDGNSNLIEFSLFHSFNDEYGSGDEGRRFTKERYKYDSNNNIISKNMIASGEKPWKTFAYQYDEQSNLIKVIETDTGHILGNGYVKEIDYLYTYDDKGNWVTQVKLEKKSPDFDTVYENGNFVKKEITPKKTPKYYIERSIEYYD